MKDGDCGVAQYGECMLGDSMSDKEYKMRAREMLAMGFVAGVSVSGSTAGSPTEDEVQRLVNLLRAGEVK